MTKENLQYLVDQAAQSQVPLRIEGHHPVMLKHDSFMIEGMERHAERPYTVKIDQQFHCQKGFLDYVNDFATDETRIFADLNRGKLEATIDYHKPDGTASHCNHNVHLVLKKDNDLESWLRRDGEGMSQQSFVRFLVDYASKVKDATYATGAQPKEINSAEFMEMVASIKSVESKDMTSSASVGGNVELKLAASQKVKSGGRDLPERISVGLPVFRGGDEYHFEFRIMVSLDDGAPRFSFKLIRPEAIIEEAFKDILDEVKGGLKDGLKVYGV